MNLNSGPKNNPLYQIWAWSSNYLENNLSLFVFSMAKMTWHTVSKRLQWQLLMRMVIDKICKMIVKGIKSKSEIFFSISHGVWELWRKTLGGRISPPAWIRLNKRKCNLVKEYVNDGSIFPMEKSDNSPDFPVEMAVLSALSLLFHLSFAKICHFHPYKR